jgi:hypothetical protein
MGSRATARTIASARGSAMRSASGAIAGLHQNGLPGLPSWAIQSKEAPMSILVLLIVLILVFGVGGGVYNKGAYRNYGYGGGGLLLIILIILLVSGYVHV